MHQSRTGLILSVLGEEMLNIPLRFEIAEGLESRRQKTFNQLEALLLGPIAHLSTLKIDSLHTESNEVTEVHRSAPFDVTCLKVGSRNLFRWIKKCAGVRIRIHIRCDREKKETSPFTYA